MSRRDEEAKDFTKMLQMNRTDKEAKDFAKMLHYTAECIIYYQRVSSLPDCNTCGDKDCEYRPGWGEQVRINCPLWK